MISRWSAADKSVKNVERRIVVAVFQKAQKHARCTLADKMKVTLRRPAL